MKYVLTESAVRKLRGVLAPRSGNTGAGGAATSVSPDDFPPPFTVRWAQSENNGSGAWVIWLNSASTHGLVLVDGALKAITHGITAATGLPTGWFTMDDVAPLVTRVWLCYGKPKGTASEALRITNSGLIEDANYIYTSVCVATMSINTATGERRVRQRVSSVVTLTSGSGGSVTLDDVSTDYNGDTEVQIKDWDTGTPASATTIAQDIHDGNTTAQGTVPERTTGGALQYKKPGTLAQLTGSTVEKSSQKILTGLSWNTTTHKLVISSAQITVSNGIITAWANNADEPIETTSISSIIPNSNS